MPAPHPVERPGDLPPAPNRPVTSRALTRFDAVTTRAGVAIVALVWVVVVWVLVVGTGFDPDLQLAFATVCSGITVTMVFVIQHTQHRAQQATQLKLDELIRSLPQADDRVVRVEASSDAEIGALEQRVAEHHRAQRVDEGSATP
ncbi:MAG TPA: low affinity iron permease family protein [Acidimicrobiia bacterium]|jgi:low affinity Fe/Cu permease